MGASGFVIVALPSVDEKVNRISSEKVPHLTLLHLGDNPENQQEIIQFVQHAASELSPFCLTVDHRGELGADRADVLFFEKDRFDLKRVSEFRHYLLLNDAIKRAYDSSDQFPEWIPHLTLGYPDTPANEDESDYPGVHGVHFDRIAVWDADYDGPEFRLKYDDLMMGGDMAMSSISELGALAASAIFGKDPNAAEHYGTKGMKWGVRKDKGHEGERVKTKKLDKLDKKWEKENSGVKGWVKVNNAVADRMNNGLIDKHNNDPRWADVKDFYDDRDPKVQEYFSEYEKLANKVWAEETVKLGSNPSGTKAYELREDADGNPYAYLAPVNQDVKHAEGDTQSVLKINRDDSGRVESVTMAELELKHYGVKGMKWGVRKDETTSRGGADKGPTATVVTQKKPGKFAKSSGGDRHPIHPDAESALHLRQKARRSTTDSLSNQELQAAVQRMQLEQKYNQLEFSNDRRSAGRRFAAGLFGRKKPTKYRDIHEEAGSEAADAVKKALAVKVAKKAAAAAV